jgi:hypothetical protein
MTRMKRPSIHVGVVLLRTRTPAGVVGAPHSDSRSNDPDLRQLTGYACMTIRYNIY